MGTKNLRIAIGERTFTLGFKGQIEISWLDKYEEHFSRGKLNNDLETWHIQGTCKKVRMLGNISPRVFISITVIEVFI